MTTKYRIFYKHIFGIRRYVILEKQHTKNKISFTFFKKKATVWMESSKEPETIINFLQSNSRRNYNLTMTPSAKAMRDNMAKLEIEAEITTKVKFNWHPEDHDLHKIYNVFKNDTVYSQKMKR